VRSNQSLGLHEGGKDHVVKLLISKALLYQMAVGSEPDTVSKNLEAITGKPVSTVSAWTR
jgi:hypothetical protein